MGRMALHYELWSIPELETDIRARSWMAISSTGRTKTCWFFAGCLRNMKQW